jgi:DNA polymerase-4
MSALLPVQRAILHVDMDAFYASIEQRDDPSIRGKPVIVGGTSGRGVVAAASYEVREFGVHSAMPIRDALRRCPQAICVSPRMNHYQSVSGELFEIFHRFTPLVQGLSLDEAFLDVTASQSALGSAQEIAYAIKRRINETTRLTASVGVAPNKLVAKIASDLHKPDGVTIVTPASVNAVLDPLPIRRLFGIGAKTAARVAALGIVTLGDLRRAPASSLLPIFGRYTLRVQQRATGIDDRPVIPDVAAKQIGAEETFAVDIADARMLRSHLWKLVDKAAGRLRSEQLQAACVTVKIRRADFATFSRQRQLQPATQGTRVFGDMAQRVLDRWLEENPRAALRLLGVSLSGLSSLGQVDLFAGLESQSTRKLDATVDEIRARFGKLAVQRASSLSGDKP